jgi:hypothetical protein
VPWRHMGERRYSSTIPDLITRWRWVISYMPQLLYSRSNSPQHPLDGRLGGPYGCYEEERNIAPAGKWTPAPWWIEITFIIKLGEQWNLKVLVIIRLKIVTIMSTFLQACSSMVGGGTMLQAGRSEVQFPTKLLDFSVHLILPISLRPWGRLSL